MKCALLECLHLCASASASELDETFMFDRRECQAWYVWHAAGVRKEQDTE